MSDEKFILKYFVYSTGWVSLSTTAGASVLSTFTIDGNYSFSCNYITVHIRQSDVLVTNFAGNIQIQDAGRDSNLFNTDIPIAAIAGSGGLPYPFNPPKLFKNNATINITLTNNVTTATDVAVVFHGNKLVPAAS